MSAWISVKDRLPEPDADVLVALRTGQVEVAYCPFHRPDRFRDVYSYYEEGTVTHWQPLPEPPEER